MTDLNIIEKEKSIYKRMYAKVPDYNKYSPGAILFPFLKDLASDYGVMSVLDAGCGKGQVVHLFDKAKYNVRGCDITLDGLSDEVNDEICVETSLCKLPFHKNEFDMVTCIDVLEHIPYELLNNSISEIARVCVKFSIIQVCTRKDVYGKRIKETLHKSVFDKTFWLNKLNEYFDKVIELEYVGGDLLLFCGV